MSNPLHNVIFAQRVIAFSAINLQQPLLCTLVTPSWAEAVFEYGAAALAWKQQITESPSTVAAEEQSTAKKVEMIDIDDDENDLAPSEFEIDTLKFRRAKAKKFLIRLLAAGSGKLQAWALQHLLSNEIGYFDLLPAKKLE